VTAFAGVAIQKARRNADATVGATMDIPGGSTPPRLEAPIFRTIQVCPKDRLTFPTTG
jgi:hypothetical protein